METEVKIEATDIVEFNCMQDEGDGEYSYFSVELYEPTDDIELAIARVTNHIKRNFGKKDKIYVIGYWQGGGCYTNGNYVNTNNWISCNEN